MSENADITSIEPYVAVAVNDTLDETRTDLPALIQRMEDQIALQNQIIRQFLQHWDSISLGVVSPIPPNSYSRQAQRVWLIKKDDGTSILVVKDNESKENWFEGVIH